MMSSKVRNSIGAVALPVALLLCACAISLIAATPAHAIGWGDTFTVGGNKYRVIDYEYDNDYGDYNEVQLVKYGSNSKAPNINMVTYRGERFEVDSIGKNAFNNSKGHRITKVTIGHKVDHIWGKAFYGCKKLEVIDLSRSDIIDLERGYGGYMVDDVEAAPNAFAKAGTSNVKVKCGVASSAYRAAYKQACRQMGLRSSVKVVR